MGECDLEVCLLEVHTWDVISFLGDRKLAVKCLTRSQGLKFSFDFMVTIF